MLRNLWWRDTCHVYGHHSGIFRCALQTGLTVHCLPPQTTWYSEVTMQTGIVFKITRTSQAQVIIRMHAGDIWDYYIYMPCLLNYHDQHMGGPGHSFITKPIFLLNNSLCCINIHVKFYISWVYGRSSYTKLYLFTKFDISSNLRFYSYYDSWGGGVTNHD